VDPGHGVRVDLESCGYSAARDVERARRIEWEHAVPASVFGRTFVEWRDGADTCVDDAGKKYKGRKCAQKSAEFSRMEADLHNLFPVVGEVNGLRSDLPMGILDSPSRRRTSSDTFHFGACKSAIESGIFLPRPEVRGDLARAHLYMNASYPERHILDVDQQALFERWDAADPPDAWERERNERIADKQGNRNGFIRGAEPGQDVR
jgi:deoxyribonuclease-1